MICVKHLVQYLEHGMEWGGDAGNASDQTPVVPSKLTGLMACQTRSCLQEPDI